MIFRLGKTYGKSFINNISRTKLFTSKVRLCSTHSDEPSRKKYRRHPGFQEYVRNLSREYENLKSNDNLSESDVKRIESLSIIARILNDKNSIEENLSSLKDLSDEKDPEMLEMIKDERKNYETIIDKLDDQLIEQVLLSFNETEDYSSVVLEVTAGVGGQEAMLFAGDLFKMYNGFVEYKGWEIEHMDLDSSELGGLRHSSSIVTGNEAYKWLKYEGGVHRVQRIPTTEKSGRIHTSTVSVAVIPQPDDYDLHIKEKDLKIETKRASGAGGQHVNTTDSAVRIVHLLTGISVECQTDRSQIKNRELAMKKLHAKIWQQEIDQRMATQQASRKSQIGSSMRNEKIRTYNFNQDRITDHRVDGGTIHNLSGFLTGGDHLNGLIERIGHQLRWQQFLDVINEYKK